MARRSYLVNLDEKLTLERGKITQKCQGSQRNWPC